MNKIYVMVIVVLVSQQRLYVSQQRLEQNIAIPIPRSLYDSMVAQRKELVMQCFAALRQDPLFKMYRWMQRCHSLNNNYYFKKQKIWDEYWGLIDLEQVSAEYNQDEIVTDPEILQQYEELDCFLQELEHQEEHAFRRRGQGPVGGELNIDSL